MAGINYLLAQAVSYCFGVVNSFILNKTWTFDKARQEMGTQLQFIQFFALNILCLSISLIGLKSLNDYLAMNIYLSKITATGVTWSIRYIGYRYWIFAGRRSMKECETI